MQFKNLKGYEPYPHQIETYEALAKIRYPFSRLWRMGEEWVRGNSITSRAPTGSGKSEVVFIPL
ncbi:MAG: hypothetical protein AB1606_06915 [Nitrospirota bacterium]